MAITFVNYQATNLGNGDTSLSDTIDIGTRTNGLLLCMVHMIVSGTPSPSATYNSVSMSLDVEYSNGNSRIWIFSLPAPTDGSNTFTVSFSGNNLQAELISSWHDGALQTTPFDTSATANGTGIPTVDHTPNNDNELIVSMYYSTANTPPTVGSGETDMGVIDTGSNCSGCSYVIQGTATTQTMDWSDVGADSWDLATASYQAAATEAARRIFITHS